MRKLTYIVLIALTACSASHNNQTDRELARVYNDYLYESDLNSIVPDGTDVNDSIVIVKNYIDTWVLNKLLVAKAEENLHSEEKDFDRQLESYRNSLIIYKYESKLLSQTLDLQIISDEIEAYYNENSDKLKLNTTILKVVWAKFSNDYPNLETISQLLYSNKDEDFDDLLMQFENSNEMFYTEDKEWIKWQDFIELVPIETTNPELFLKQNDKLIIETDNDRYFVKIIDFREKDSQSPLEFEYDKIEQILINKKKRKLLEEMHLQLFDKALSDNNFEIY